MEAKLLTIVDPRGRIENSMRTGNARDRVVRLPGSIAGVRFGFLGNGKPNVSALLNHVDARLREHGAEPSRTFTKAGPLGPAPADAIETLVQEADVVVIGVSDGGTATSWGVRDAVECINLGVPVFQVCTRAFAPLAWSIMPPDLRGLMLLEIDHPFSSVGDDEVASTGDAVFHKLVELVRTGGERPAYKGDVANQCDGRHGLDVPLVPVEVPRGLEPSDSLYELGLTDGLPVGIPTVERVARKIAAWQGSGDLRVLAVPPRRGLAGAAELAANAVLAGLPDRLLPYLAAAVDAACAPEFNLFGLQTTTNPATPAVVVGGPGRLRAGFNQGLGALGPGNMGNATLGRALRLCMQNLGGARAADGSDPATMGQPGKYSFCFAADEDGWPWPPLRMQTKRAIAHATDDSVTVVAVTGSVNMIIKCRSADELLDMIAGSIRIAGSNDYMFGGHPLLVLCPEHASIFRRDGLSLNDIRRELFERTKIPFSSFLPKNREMMLAPRAHEFERLDEATLIPIVADPNDLLVCVAGGFSMHSTYLPSFGGSIPVTAVVPGRALDGADD